MDGISVIAGFAGNHRNLYPASIISAFYFVVSFSYFYRGLSILQLCGQ